MKKKKKESVYVTDMKDLVSIQYYDSSNSMTFIKKEDSWYYESDKALSLDQSLIEEMENTFGKLVAVRQLEEPDALADYGLDEARYTIVLEDANGNVTTIYLGDAVEETE